MKKLLFLCLLGACFTLLSCGDDDEPVDFVSATINGNDFNASTVLSVSDNSFGEELVLINGTESPISIGLNIPTSVATNTDYPVEADDFGITFTDDGSNAFFTVGSVRLTTNNTNDNVLEGTFNFVATQDTDPANIYTVTNGEFRVTYQ